jgi:hypothetical protein
MILDTSLDTVQQISMILTAAMSGENKGTKGRRTCPQAGQESKDFAKDERSSPWDDG